MSRQSCLRYIFRYFVSVADQLRTDREHHDANPGVNEAERLLA